MLRSKKLLTWKGIGLLLLISALLTACGGKDSPAEALVIYKVSASSEQEQTITTEEFDKFYNVTKFLDPNTAFYEQMPGFKQDMLNQYISMRIFGERLSDDAKEEADKQVEEDFELFESQIPEETQDQFKEEDLELSDFKSLFELYTYANAYMDSQVEEADMQRLYDETLEADENAFTVATVSHILIGTIDPTTQEETRTQEEALELAETVREKLLAGEDFAEMAKEYSDDTGSKDNGGTYENANVNGWVEGFREAALELPLNTISEPVETIYGYHIMQVSDRKVATLEDVKDELRSQVISEQFKEFLDNELNELVIENNLPEPEVEEDASDDASSEDGEATSENDQSNNHEDGAESEGSSN